ncbi:uncharacterized protein LOC113234611, partial [Hyposmocoma kahamanoa]|uniref:uncharacterized protein LOC113234611 n=1 Tax=Hyposmocoma kahamanoa TaxID=1477025 RepID=UPI000E6D905B
MRSPVLAAACLLPLPPPSPLPSLLLLLLLFAALATADQRPPRRSLGIAGSPSHAVARAVRRHFVTPVGGSSAAHRQVVVRVPRYAQPRRRRRAVVLTTLATAPPPPLRRFTTTARMPIASQYLVTFHTSWILGPRPTSNKLMLYDYQ